MSLKTYAYHTLIHPLSANPLMGIMHRKPSKILATLQLTHIIKKNRKKKNFKTKLKKII